MAELEGGALTPNTLAEAAGALEVEVEGAAELEGLTEVVDGLTEVVEGLTEVDDGLTEVVEGLIDVVEGLAEVDVGVDGALAI